MANLTCLLWPEQVLKNECTVTYTFDFQLERSHKGMEGFINKEMLLIKYKYKDVCFFLLQIYTPLILFFPPKSSSGYFYSGIIASPALWEIYFVIWVKIC